MPERPVLTPRPNNFGDRAAAGPELPVYAVRRSQARLGRDPVARTVAEYPERATWQQVAESLTEQYFPRSVRDGNSATLEAVTRLYCYALLFYPRQFRLKGTYRPDWTRAVLLSWYRRSVGPATRQWWAAHLHLDTPTDLGQTLDNARRYLRIEAPADWLADTFQFLDDQAQEPGRRGDLARLIYLPLALSHQDAQWRERTQFDALPKQRAVLRVQKIGTVGYVRRGRDLWLLADRYAQARLSEVPWVDLREGRLDVWDYRISWQESATGAGVCLELRPEVLETLTAHLKGLLASEGRPQYVLHQINQVLEAFIAQHRWATGAGRQLFELDRWLYQQVRQVLMPRYPEAGKRLTYLKGRLSTALALPRPSLFLDPQAASEAVWRAMFSPYR